MPLSSESDSNTRPRLEETPEGSPIGEPRDEGGGERRLTGPERREGSIGALWTLQQVAVTGDGVVTILSRRAGAKKSVVGVWG